MYAKIFRFPDAWNGMTFGGTYVSKMMLRTQLITWVHVCYSMKLYKREVVERSSRRRITRTTLVISIGDDPREDLRVWTLTKFRSWGSAATWTLTKIRLKKRSKFTTVVSSRGRLIGLRCAKSRDCWAPELLRPPRWIQECGKEAGREWGGRGIERRWEKDGKELGKVGPSQCLGRIHANVN